MQPDKLTFIGAAQTKHGFINKYLTAHKHQPKNNHAVEFKPVTSLTPWATRVLQSPFRPREANWKVPFITWSGVRPRLSPWMWPLPTPLGSCSLARLRFAAVFISFVPLQACSVRNGLSPSLSGTCHLHANVKY